MKWKQDKSIGNIGQVGRNNKVDNEIEITQMRKVVIYPIMIGVRTYLEEEGCLKPLGLILTRIIFI